MGNRMTWEVTPEAHLEARAGGEKKFSSTQVNIPEPLRSRILLLGRRIKPEHLAEEGLEEEPHVTVKYGLHTNVPAEVERVLTGEPSARISLGKTSLFQGGKDGDVVKVEVHSPDLHWLNKQLAESVEHTDTHPKYTPHITLGYVKTGLGKHYAGMKDLDGEEFDANEVVFSDLNGKHHPIHLGDSPTPESPETVQAQLQQLTEGKRKAVLLTPGEKVMGVPEGVKTLQTPRGTFYYDVNKINARTIKRAIDFDRLSEILGDSDLGYGAPNKKDLEGPISAVTAREGDVDVQSVATDQKNLLKTVEAAKRVGSKVWIEPPEEVLKRRAKQQ